MESPITGLAIENQGEGKRPIAVMVDGSLKAHPQAGLGAASMVIAAEVEFSIPRYMALFADQAPQRVGPIRSVRPYYLDWAIAYQPFLLHCGGSPEAIERLRKPIALIDADYVYLFNKLGEHVAVSKMDFFVRREDRAAPHNLYANLKQLRQCSAADLLKAVNANLCSFSTEELLNFSSYESILHNEELLQCDSATAESAQIQWPGGKRVYYSFQPSKCKYLRLIEGLPGMDERVMINDENSGKPIEIDNVAIITVDIELLKGDLKKRLAIRTLDQGPAVYLIGGRVFKGSWLKINHGMAIRFFDSVGRRISFNRGNLWVEVISNKEAVKFEKLFHSTENGGL